MEWRKNRAFTDALKARQYLTLVDGRLQCCCSDGIYLYMYELWQDGRALEKFRSRLKQVDSTDRPK